TVFNQKRSATSSLLRPKKSLIRDRTLPRSFNPVTYLSILMGSCTSPTQMPVCISCDTKADTAENFEYVAKIRAPCSSYVDDRHDTACNRTRCGQAGRL